MGVFAEEGRLQGNPRGPILLEDLLKGSMQLEQAGSHLQRGTAKLAHARVDPLQLT